MEEKSDLQPLEALLSEIQFLLTSKKYLLSFQRNAESELLKLQNILRNLFEEVARKILKHFEQILLTEEEKITLGVSTALMKLEKQLLDLKFKHGLAGHTRDSNFSSILRHIDSEKQRLMDFKKCSIKVDTSSSCQAFLRIIGGTIQVEVSNAEMSDQERIRRQVAQSEDNSHIIIQPLVPKIDFEQVKIREAGMKEERKERKLSQRGLPQGSIVLIKTVQDEPKVGFQMNTPLLITTIHKRMQGVVGKQHLSVEEVVNLKKLGPKYAIKYKIEVLEGWQGSVRKIQEVIQEAKFVKECHGIQQKAGEGCTIF